MHSSLYDRLTYSNTPGAANGISPVFASLTDRIVAKKDSGIDAVNPSVNVQYLKLSALEGLGNLAKTVYRVDTAGGQPGPAVSLIFILDPTVLIL